MSYYQAISFEKLGDKKKSKEIFNSLISYGGKMIENKTADSDFFEIFGERLDANTLQSMAYTLRGLGYKGLGKEELAKKDLDKAVELKASNMWASVERK